MNIVEAKMGELPWGRRRPRPEFSTSELHKSAGVLLSAELTLRPEQLHSLAALFPAARFDVVDDRRLPPPLGSEVLVTRARASSAPDVAARLSQLSAGRRVIVVLDAPNLAVTRLLMANGAADVLYEPVTEAAIALSLERVFAIRAQISSGLPSSAGQVVALLKAGGGVGATTLGVQAAAILSGRGMRACFADLDVQWGAAGLYLDLPDALTIADCVTAGTSLAETNFISRLAVHRTGVRLVAAPNDVAPLELLDEGHVDALLRSLRQEMGVTLIDLPSDWSAWTNHLLHSADRIVVVTRLTVGNLQLTKRQLRMLSNQQLDGTPLTLVCNAVSHDQEQSLSVKAAERALGRPFDVVIPDEGRLMREANNQGVELAALQRTAKLLKSVTALADAIAPATVTSAAAR
jgi:pilus assembly protein CpaE